jgi:hypothetical protein
MDEYPVKVGRTLFTMVDPNPGFEKAYNRWYERDHYYGGCMIGPWWFAGSRWVATRRLKELRFPDTGAVADPIDAGSYLSVYWVHKDHEAEAGQWAGEQVARLYGGGRGFAERTHRHTFVYEYLGTVYRDDDGVPIELALDHRYPGLGVVMVEPAAGTSRDELQEWLATEAAPALLRDSHIDMIASWGTPPPDPNVQRLTPRPGETPPPGAPGGASLGTSGGSSDRILQLVFIEADPADVWDLFHAYAKVVDESGKGAVTFAAPFIKTVVGTDTYVDEL